MTSDRNTAPEGAGPVDSTGPGAASSNGAPPWRAIAAVAGLVLIVAVIAAALLLRDDPGRGAAPSPTPEATASAEPTASAGESASPSPSAAPSPNEPIAIPTEWTAAATFSEAGKRYVVGDLQPWSGGLVAVGTLYEEEARGVFGPPPPRSGVVWIATDGTDWAVAQIGDAFDGAEPQHVLVRGDGSLLVLGHTWPGVDRVDAAWTSDDGLSWSPVTLAGVPAGAAIIDVAHGPLGYVASMALGTSGSLLFSADAVTWVETRGGIDVRDVGAGPEGFVAAVASIGSGASAVLASSDGQEWFEAAPPPPGNTLVAPSGADWLAVGSEFGSTFTATSWGSANGLDWTELGDVPLADVSFSSGGQTTTCQEAPAELHSVTGVVLLGMTLLGPCSEGGVIAAGGSYATQDGVEWSQLPFGDQATIRGAVAVGDRIVAVTDTATNQAPTIGVTFWISEP